LKYEEREKRKFPFKKVFKWVKRLVMVSLCPLGVWELISIISAAKDVPIYAAWIIGALLIGLSILLFELYMTTTDE